MNDKKQIEEFARDIGESLGITYEGEQLPFRLKTRNYLAEALYNEGYRKIPKGTVVMSKEEIEIRQENYINGIKFWQDMANKARKHASIEFSERVKSKIIELRRKYHEDYVNGLGDEEYNGLTENNVDELLKEMGVK